MSTIEQWAKPSLVGLPCNWWILAVVFYLMRYGCTQVRTNLGDELWMDLCTHVVQSWMYTREGNCISQLSSSILSSIIKIEQ